MRSWKTIICLLILAWSSSCGGQGNTGPVEVARQYASAVLKGDVDALLPLLETELQQQIRDSAERASDQIGGRRKIEGNEMLQVDSHGLFVEVVELRLLGSEDGRAQVEVKDSLDRLHVVELLLEQGPERSEWRVLIPTPNP